MRIARPDQRWTITVSKEKFAQLKHDPEFCAVLALGRAVNALHFVHTPLLTEGDTPRHLRDRYNSLLFTCALFAEAMLVVERLDKNLFQNHPEFQKVKNITGGAEAQALRKQLFILRNTLVFHFDVEQVQEQMAGRGEFLGADRPSAEIVRGKPRTTYVKCVRGLRCRPTPVEIHFMKPARHGSCHGIFRRKLAKLLGR